VVHACAHGRIGLAAAAIDNPWMTSPAPFDHLRHAALEMLDAGNSTASVSQVLVVPAAVITRWRDEPVPPRPQAADVLLALGATGHAPTFTTTLVVKRSAPAGPGGLAMADYVRGALIVGLVVAGYGALTHSTAFFRSVWVDLTPLVTFGLLRLGRNRALFKLDDRGIVVPRLFRNQRMPYRDLADWWLVMHVQGKDTDQEVEGRRLTLHSRRKGVAPIELFVADYVSVAPEVTERLDLVKKANAGVGPLTPIRSIPKTSTG
jgi:hypothetical protein